MHRDHKCLSGNFKQAYYGFLHENDRHLQG
jgi:hypothetical protein